MLAPVLIVGIELSQLHLIHVIRDPHLLPRREESFQLRKLFCRKPVFFGKDHLQRASGEKQELLPFPSEALSGAPRRLNTDSLRTG